MAYLLWLAWEGWTDAEKSSSAAIEANAADASFFTRGLISNLLNPKAAIFYVTVVPAFVNEANATFGQTVILSVVYVSIATAIHTTIVAFASSARPIVENADMSRVVRRVLSVALAIIAIWFASATSR